MQVQWSDLIGKQILFVEKSTVPGFDDEILMIHATDGEKKYRYEVQSNYDEDYTGNSENVYKTLVPLVTRFDL